MPKKGAMGSVFPQRIPYQYKIIMHVEAFHRVLKHVYLKGKVNKRLDKCIEILVKLARDKGFERLVKLEKEKISERINQIRVRHQASLRMPLSLVTEMEEYLKWEVHSADGKNIYHISQLNKLCPYSCSVICADCHICIHMYSCNCPDSLIRATICKHVHLLMRFISSTGNTSIVSGEVSQQDIMEETEMLQRVQDVTQMGQLTIYREGIQNQLIALAGYLNTITDMSTLHDVKAFITSALNLIKARQNSSVMTLPVPKHQPPNKRIPIQRPFFSTKRKRNRANIRLAKPTIEEKVDICKALLNGTLNQECPPIKQSTYCK